METHKRMTVELNDQKETDHILEDVPALRRTGVYNSSFSWECIAATWRGDHSAPGFQTVSDGGPATAGQEVSMQSTLIRSAGIGDIWSCFRGKMSR